MRSRYDCRVCLRSGLLGVGLLMLLVTAMHGAYGEHTTPEQFCADGRLDPRVIDCERFLEAWHEWDGGPAPQPIIREDVKGCVFPGDGSGGVYNPEMWEQSEHCDLVALGILTEEELEERRLQEPATVGELEQLQAELVAAEFPMTIVLLGVIGGVAAGGGVAWFAMRRKQGRNKGKEEPKN